ncbi:hypothetical protein LUZ61_005707 [Rhynchospora tenuis]|uniref:DDE Tnp4 domain-containing protein n=1 Tax=Rhynchospora tenuis TaxID=198213 RepID=A0AAD5ZQ17_9POAL|nr:hypothetical protein LUZ61_005707 [Rhynchospora tenuis]
MSSDESSHEEMSSDDMSYDEMSSDEDVSSDDANNYSKRRERNKRVAAWWFNAAMCAADSRELKRGRKLSGAEYIRETLRGSDSYVQEIYRLTPENFRLLGDELLARGLPTGGDLIIEEHVGMFLQLVAQGSPIRKLCFDFQHSEETDALGAIDGTHIPAFPERDEPFKERWRNGKGNMTQNVMAVVDFNGNFRAVVAGWEGSAHDSLVLRRTIDAGFTVPEGRYYLVDGGYANTHQFLAPYRGKTYHLAQFQQRRPRNRYENAEELYNHRHAQLRNVVEKAFGILKGRFRILKDMHRYKYSFQTNLVIACCVLHNFINRHQKGQVDFEEDATSSDDSDDPDNDVSSTSANVSGGTDAQRGGALRDSIRDKLWNARRTN